MYFSYFHKALLTLTPFCLSYSLYFFVSLWYAMCLRRVQRVAYYCTLVRCQGIYPWDFCCLDKGYLVAWDLLQGPHPWLCPKLVFLGVATEFCVSYSVSLNETWGHKYVQEHWKTVPWIAFSLPKPNPILLPAPLHIQHMSSSSWIVKRPRGLPILTTTLLPPTAYLTLHVNDHLTHTQSFLPFGLFSQVSESSSDGNPALPYPLFLHQN